MHRDRLDRAPTRQANDRVAVAELAGAGTEEREREKPANEERKTREREYTMTGRASCAEPIEVERKSRSLRSPSLLIRTSFAEATHRRPMKTKGQRR